MSDTTLNRFVGQGTNAERLAFVPDPATPVSGPLPGYFFFETDTGDTYAWDIVAGAWVLLIASSPGTVTSVSVVSANGFAGSVATATSTPAITIQTTLTSGQLPVANGSGGFVSAPVTGAGNVVLSTSPTLVSPNLGTPSAIVLTNATGFPTLNQNTTGSAATLTTPRNINGVAFNGSADITVTAAAGTLTGTTLAATVVTSSLTALGTIATGMWQGTAVGPVYGGTGITSYTTGDLLYASATNVLSKLAATTNTFVLTLTGGVPVWAAPSGGGGTPGGSTTQLQYNNAGAFGGISGATTNGTATTYTASNLIATSPRFVTGINDTNGNELLLLTATGSAVNEFTVANAATGSNPRFTASGGDTNVGFDFFTKGNGKFRIVSPSTESAELLLNTGSDSGPNAICTFQINGTSRAFFFIPSSAGSGVTGAAAYDLIIRTQGSNIDFTTDSGTTICGQFVLTTGQLLLPKTITSTTAASGALVAYSVGITQNLNVGGTASVTGVLSATSPRFTTGINDANGNELFLLTATGSAVNEFTVANAATGSNPRFTASGGDSNVGFDFFTKGTGKFRVVSPSTQSSELHLVTGSDSGPNGILQFTINATARALIAVPSSAGGMVTGSAAYDLVIRTQGGNIDFTTDSGSTINFQIVGSAGGIKTLAPAGASNHAWLLGSVVSGAVTLDAANSVYVNINGSVVKLLKAA